MAEKMTAGALFLLIVVVAPWVLSFASLVVEDWLTRKFGKDVTR